MSIYQEIPVALLGALMGFVLGLVFMAVILLDVGTVFRHRLAQRYADWLRHL